MIHAKSLCQAKRVRQCTGIPERGYQPMASPEAGYLVDSDEACFRRKSQATGLAIFNHLVDSKRDTINSIMVNPQ